MSVSEGGVLTFDLSQAALLLLRVLLDAAQVVQLGAQELTLAQRLLLQVALLSQLGLQLAHAPTQRLAQTPALERGGEGGKSVHEASLYK